jgi:C4-dicarboxylate transporter, DctM subunit
MIAILFILIIIFIAILGTPLFSVIASIAIVNFTNSGSNTLIVLQEMTGIADKPLLYTIPLFTFAGYILASGNFSQRLVRLIKAALGWMPGGLPIVTLLACAIFTAFTGVSSVTIIALGAFLLPILLKEKYNEKFSYGLITTSGSIGLLFMPSLALILFGVIAGASIDKLFVAGIIPGLLIILIYSLYSIAMSLRYKIATTKFSVTELKEAFLDMKWEIPLPLVLFIGVFSGKIAISDMASIIAIYVFIVEVLILKDIKLKKIPGIMKDSMILVGAILIIMSAALAATNYAIYAEIPQKILLFLKNFITSKWMFLIILNIFLLITGSFLELYSSLVILVPLIIPIAESYNINIIHLGIIFLTNLEIGFLLPPFGLNLFIASLRFEKPLVELFKPTIRFLILSFAALMLITYIPELSIWFIEKPSVVGVWEYKDETGASDRIILKAGGIFLRKQGSMIEMMMNQPEIGKYEIMNNKLVLIKDSEKNYYTFEI